VSWFAVDDRFHSHRKVLSMRRSPAYGDAVALRTLSGSWCAGQVHESLTGRIPVDVVASFGIPGWSDALDLLVKVGLWEVPDGDAAQFHDWEMWNCLDGKANRSREQTRVRVERYRKRQCDIGQHSKDCPAETCPEKVKKARRQSTRNARNATPGRDASGRDGTGTSSTELRLEEKEQEHARESDDPWSPWKEDAS